MNDQTAPPENAEPTAPATPPRKAPLADLFARMNLTQLTLAVLMVVFLWQWLDGHLVISDMRQQMAEKIAEMNGSSKANQILLAQSQEQMRELSVQLATLESRYAESQNQRGALESFYSELSASRDETALADVEQMLMIAAQQLQLSGNVKAALIAMQNADARMQHMDRASAFDDLRKIIWNDMGKLRALPGVDVADINLQLNNLINIVDEMPLTYGQRVASESAGQAAPSKDETFWQRLSREVWQELKQLVRIDDTGKAEIPLLPPSQEFFLRENLKIRLLSARLALLSRDQDSFRQELKTAQFWTARYFDDKSSQGTAMIAGLKKLSAANIDIELPDIGASLQAVRSYRLARENTPQKNIPGRNLQQKNFPQKTGTAHTNKPKASQ